MVTRFPESRILASKSSTKNFLILLFTYYSPCPSTMPHRPRNRSDARTCNYWQDVRAVWPVSQVNASGKWRIGRIVSAPLVPRFCVLLRHFLRLFPHFIDAADIQK